MDNIKAAAKQAQNNKQLMEIMRQDFTLKSMTPNGDCMYKLMGMWQRIYKIRSSIWA